MAMFYMQFLCLPHEMFTPLNGQLIQQDSAYFSGVNFQNYPCPSKKFLIFALKT